MNLCSLERLWKAWLTGTSLSEASKHADDGSNKRQWNGTEGEAGMAEIGRGLLRPGPWKSDWIGRSDVVSVGSSRRMQIRWCLGVPFSERRSRSGTLREWSGMKYDWPDGQQHSHVSSVLQSHHPFHRVLHSHLTQKMDQIWQTFIIQPLLSSILPPLTSSSSLRVSSSMRRMSSMFNSIHLSIQQNSWRWKLVNRRFSCFKFKKRKEKENHVVWGSGGLHVNSWVTINRDLLDEVLHFVLQAPPLEFDGDQFVRAHVGAVFLGMELLLQEWKHGRRD